MKNLFATFLVTLIFYIGCTFSESTLDIKYWTGNGAVGLFYIVTAIVVNIVVCAKNVDEKDKLF